MNETAPDPGPRLWAISDLHLNYEVNREGIAALPDYGDDWLILGGDIGDGPEALGIAFDILQEKFAKLFWVPGNHELWCRPGRGLQLGGEARYEALVAFCRERGVVTPEDPYVAWEGPGEAHLITPCFALYDYSFRPPDVPREGVIAWAREHGILANDERFLLHEPFPSRDAWCADRVARTEARLAAAPALPKVLINHWPLRRDLVRLARVPRYSPWCGTQLTREWHTRWNVAVVINGHLHMRATDWKSGVRFEEVALGYPRHWKQERGVAHYLRQILPGPAERPQNAGPEWRF